jgi:hypothetical protein
MTVDSDANGGQGMSRLESVSNVAGEPNPADFAAAPNLTAVFIDAYHASSPEGVQHRYGIGLRSRHVTESLGVGPG